MTVYQPTAVPSSGSRPEIRRGEPDPRERTELWLVRHGESTGNRDGLFQGQADLPLSTLGRSQAELLARRLASTHFAAIYASDLIRALDTALIIAQTVGVAVASDQRLREIDVGTWSGLTVEEIARRFPEDWNRWLHQRDPQHRRGGGESYVDLQTRLVLVLTDLANRHPGRNVLVVAHGGALNSYLAHVLGMPLGTLWRLTLGNTSLTRILPFANPTLDDSQRPGRVLVVNDCSHLEAARLSMREVEPLEAEDDAEPDTRSTRRKTGT